jgi:hypothetical protein
MSPFAQALAGSPELFPGAFDPLSGTVTLWRLSCADYEQSAFLDGRIAAGKNGRQVSFSELARAVEEAALPESCDFIFHIGHAGSTLLSRLVGRHPALFSVREPDILRTLANLSEKGRRDSYLTHFLRLWSRTFKSGALAIVKTTSFVSEIAADLLSRPGHPRALAMGVAPETYLATIFSGANAPAEARALAASRLARINRRVPAGWQLQDLGAGEIVALGWACETLCLAEAAETTRDRVLVFNFDRFLADAHETLHGALAHFGVEPTDSDITEILSGSEMRSYSKAPEYRYDADTRRAVLAEGRTRHANHIRHGLLWLERAAAEYPAIARALSLFN